MKKSIIAVSLATTVLAGLAFVSPVFSQQKAVKQPVIQHVATEASAPVQTAAKTATKAKTTKKSDSKPLKSYYLIVDPLDLVKKPAEFMKKDVQFEATFNRFSDLGLDYPKALRESTDFVNVLVLRPDVGNHQIPLSELKLFFPRKKSADVMELESGDVVNIKGSVFSSAMNDPWLDIDEIKILKKLKEKEEKKAAEECC